MKKILGLILAVAIMLPAQAFGASVVAAFVGDSENSWAADWGTFTGQSTFFRLTNLYSDTLTLAFTATSPAAEPLPPVGGVLTATIGAGQGVAWRPNTWYGADVGGSSELWPTFGSNTGKTSFFGSVVIDFWRGEWDSGLSAGLPGDLLGSITVWWREGTGGNTGLAQAPLTLIPAIAE